MTGIYIDLTVRIAKFAENVLPGICRAGRNCDVEMSRILGNILSFSASLFRTGAAAAMDAAAALIVAALIVAGCGGRGGRTSGSGSDGGVSDGGGQKLHEAAAGYGGAGSRGEVRTFPQLTVPAVIEDGDERAEYAALHWFDPFTRIEGPAGAGESSGRGVSGNGQTAGHGAVAVKWLCDSTHIAGVPSEQLEQAFATWCGLLDRVPLETAEKASARLFGRIAACEAADTASNIFERMNAIADKYLYDPNSPLRNEDFYRPFVQARSQSELVSPEQREADGRTARSCALNRVGTKAADFRFSEKSGRMYTLYGIKAETTLLFFSNPGCKACKDIIDALKSRPEMETMIASGELAVLNIYIDENLAEWYNYMPIYPESWHNGYDPDYVIRTDRLYDVRAIPSLYLLNRDKIVLMKDAPPEKVLAAIFGN